MSRNRNRAFTLNNWTGEEEKQLMEWKGIKYIVFGYEIGEGGTSHLQGYVEFYEAKSLTALKKFNERIHWETRKGTAAEAADYCKKDLIYYERGSISRPGTRTDLARVANDVRSRQSITNIAESDPVSYIKYFRGIHNLRMTLHKDRTIAPFVAWRWGKAGVGKTRHCYELHKNSVYMKDGSKWWDNYDQQEAIIIDDFDGQWPFRDFLRLLDRYPHQVQYKGGYVKVNSPFIYITCEFPPDHFWHGNELQQVLRRITLVTEVTTTVEGNTNASTTDANRQLPVDDEDWLPKRADNIKWPKD